MPDLTIRSMDFPVYSFHGDNTFHIVCGLDHGKSLPLCEYTLVMTLESQSDNMHFYVSMSNCCFLKLTNRLEVLLLRLVVGFNIYIYFKPSMLHMIECQWKKSLNHNFRAHSNLGNGHVDKVVP